MLRVHTTNAKAKRSIWLLKLNALSCVRLCLSSLASRQRQTRPRTMPGERSCVAFRDIVRIEGKGSGRVARHVRTSSFRRLVTGAAASWESSWGGARRPWVQGDRRPDRETRPWREAGFYCLFVCRFAVRPSPCRRGRLHQKRQACAQPPVVGCVAVSVLICGA